MSATVWYASSSEYATLTNTFKVSGVVTDPTAVSVKITDPTGTVTTYTYALGQVTRASEGVYKIDVACSTAGIWTYEWTGTSPAADVVAGTWTVATASLNTFYCSVEEIKSRFGIADTADDFEATFAVQCASRGIDDICDRYFWRGTDTRTYVPTSSYHVVVDDLVSVTSFKTDDDGDGVFENTWVTGAYTLEVFPGKYNNQVYGELWPYTRVKTLGVNYLPVVNPWGRMDLVQVTGVFGWPAVPLSVKQACLIAAADMFKLKDAPFGIAGFSEYGAVRVRQNPRVMALLNKYISESKVGV